MLPALIVAGLEQVSSVGEDGPSTPDLHAQSAGWVCHCAPPLKQKARAEWQLAWKVDQLCAELAEMRSPCKSVEMLLLQVRQGG